MCSIFLNQWVISICNMCLRVELFLVNCCLSSEVTLCLPVHYVGYRSCMFTHFVKDKAIEWTLMYQHEKFCMFTAYLLLVHYVWLSIGNGSLFSIFVNIYWIRSNQRTISFSNTLFWGTISRAFYTVFSWNLFRIGK